MTTEKKLSVWELIDKYVPTVTRAAVLEMTMKHEEQVSNLLGHIHRLHQQYEGVAKHLYELEEEYGKRSMIAVNMGSVTSMSEYMPMEQVSRYSIRWQPSPLQANIIMSDRPISRDEFPHLFAAAMRQFDVLFDKEIKPKLQVEYAKLYDASNPRM